MVEYRGGRTLDSLVKFVKSGGKDHGVGSEEEMDDDMLDSLEDYDIEDAEADAEEDAPATGKYH